MSTPQQPLSEISKTASTPPELTGQTLPAISPEPTAVTTLKEPLQPPPKEQAQAYLPFISLVHSYLWSAITLADQKAGFLFAATSAFLGYLLSKGLLIQLKPPWVGWGLPHWLALASLLLLLAAMGVAIHIVMPRLGGNSAGLVYFKAIASRKDRQLYVSDVTSCTNTALDSALAEHSYEIAKISTRKYSWLRFGMWIGLSGFIAGLGYIGVTQ